MPNYAQELAEDLVPRVGRSSEADATGSAYLRQTPVVILAGGRGTRLAPYTSILPKPLMPVGEHAILEIVVDQLAACGVERINLCVGYLAHLIRAVFERRRTERVRISYVHEGEPLGTAAPLRLVTGLDETFIVMNGDVLTTLDYRDLVRHHRASGNVLTIATHERAITIDYGILRLDETSRVRGFDEKPEIVSSVSMGIYVMEPSVLQHIPEARSFDFPDLVRDLLQAGAKVGAYRYDGLWFDIGRHDDYERAVETWASNGLLTGGAAHVNGNGNGNGNAPTSGHDITTNGRIHAMPSHGEDAQRPHAEVTDTWQ